MKAIKLNHVVLFFALLASFASNIVAAPLGTAFTYQGRLASGTDAANGLYDFSFILFDADSGGTQKGPPLSTNGLAVTNGLFTATLDFGSVFDDTARWLEIAVRTNGSGAFTTLAPRQLLTPAPYALYAPIAGTAATAASVPAGNLTGTLADAQLSTNVALLNANQTFTGSNSFSGNVGIGTTTPSETLHVVGKIRIVDGSHGTNRVLTSDATGTARWQQTEALLSVGGVSNPGGNVDLLAGTNMTISPDPIKHAIRFDADSPSCGVKRVIRGVTPVYGVYEYSKTVSFSPSIDPAKAITLVPNRAILMTDAGNQAWAIVTDLTSSSITIEICRHAGSFKASFQIVEYY